MFDFILLVLGFEITCGMTISSAMNILFWLGVVAPSTTVDFGAIQCLKLLYYYIIISEMHCQN